METPPREQILALAHAAQRPEFREPSWWAQTARYLADFIVGNKAAVVSSDVETARAALDYAATHDAHGQPATPSPATVDVGEARAFADELAMFTDSGFGWTYRQKVPAMLRSLASALEASEKRASEQAQYAEALGKEAADACEELEQEVVGHIHTQAALAGLVEWISDNEPGATLAQLRDSHEMFDARAALAQLRPVTTEGK